MSEKRKHLGIEEIANEFDLDRTNPKINSFLIALITRDQEKNVQIEEARNKARYDSLTGLERKENLYPFLERNMARADRHDEDLSILMIDADNFKLYNDTFGHLQGDEALKTIGSIIREELRREDLAVRYGGEEIAIALPETDTNELEQIAERIRSRVENTQLPKAVKDKEMDEGYKHMTVSIGGVTYNTNLKAVLGFLDVKEEDRVKKLIENADSALYEAKDQGRNRYCVVEEE